MNWSSGAHRWGQPFEDVVSVQGDRLDAERFEDRFVDACLPLVVRAATNHWPAAKRWNQPDYLPRVLEGRTFAVHDAPVLEMRWRQRHWPECFIERFASQRTTDLTIAEIAERAATDELVFAYAVGVDATTALAPLVEDVGKFDFVPNPGRPHYYKPLRAFVHGISYTDWHYHPDDSTLMCQFGRAKTVHLLPPCQATWDVFYEVAARENYIGTADPARFPRLKTLRPLRATVHPGDALYIPPNWWHAVACSERGAGLGVTLAYCWGSPWHIRLDPRFPFHRFYLRHGRPVRRVQLVGAAAAWSALRLVGRTLAEIPKTAVAQHISASQ